MKTSTKKINRGLPTGFSSNNFVYFTDKDNQLITDTKGSQNVANEFKKLAEAWSESTEFYSSLTDIVLDPSYQKIIGLGIAVVPFILQELQKKPDHWYWALAAITQDNPAENVTPGDISGICDAWLGWGIKRGIVK